MDKLYVNVTRCDVIGGAQALTPIVTEMDKRLQELANETQTMKGILCKFLGSNTSEQYEKATVAVCNLSEFLFNASEQLNEMQGQIVRYQDAIARYNERSDSFSAPNAHNVQKVQIGVDTKRSQFTYDEMIHVNQSIQKYTSDARTTARQLKSNKESIGSIWRDPQFRDFSAFIDEIVSKTENSIVTLEEYSTHLSQKIKEFKN